jgi:hypothetical protein
MLLNRLLFSIFINYLFFVTICFAQDFSIFRISRDTGIHTDRRPVSVAFYDKTVNKTFLSWMGPYSCPVVKSYDHSTFTWSDAKIAGISPFADSHNYPAMIQAKNGKLILFYGCHNSVMRITTSPAPASIEGTWNDRDLSEAQGATYPAPIVTTDGTIYCFYRITMKDAHPFSDYPTDYRPLAFVKSSDHGETWSPAVIIIDNYPRPDNLCEVYTGKVTYQPASDGASERIHLAWTFAGGGPSGHDHGAYRRNVYYAFMDLANEHFYDIKGNDLGIDINDAEAENNCKIVDTGNPPQGENVGHQVSVHFCDNGDPVVIYRHDGFKCAYRNGTEWGISTIYAKESDPRDIEKIGPNAFRTFRTAGETIYVFKSLNRGKSWELENKIQAPARIARCYVIDNYRPDLKYLLTEMKDDDRNVEAGSRDVYIGSITTSTDLYRETPQKITANELGQNYPNPFNAMTRIPYTLAESGFVELVISDLLGRKITTLVTQIKGRGSHTAEFDAKQLSSGLYFYTIRSGKFSDTKKFLLIQ